LRAASSHTTSPTLACFGGALADELDVGVEGEDTVVVDDAADVLVLALLVLALLVLALLALAAFAEDAALFVDAAVDAVDVALFVGVLVGAAAALFASSPPTSE
jgi:hypothetical protein